MRPGKDSKNASMASRAAPRWSLECLQDAIVYTLIVSCKMNDIDPQAWMADVLARMSDITVSRLTELLPWNWKTEQKAVKAA